MRQSTIAASGSCCSAMAATILGRCGLRAAALRPGVPEVFQDDASSEEAMRSRTILAALPIVLLGSGQALAEDRTTVTACDTLLAARRIDAATGPAREAPEAGCRKVPKADIGSVEQRALIGGAPYECMTVAGAARCLWVVP
jgi:hypothetical protein